MAADALRTLSRGAEPDRERIEARRCPRTALTPRDQALVCLLRGGSALDAAREAGVTDRTVRTWQREPEFARELADRRRDALEQTCGRLQSAAEKAVEFLEQIVGDRNQKTTHRINAAKTILFWSSKLVAQLAPPAAAPVAAAQDQPTNTNRAVSAPEEAAVHPHQPAVPEVRIETPNRERLGAEAAPSDADTDALPWRKSASLTPRPQEPETSNGLRRDYSDFRSETLASERPRSLVGAGR